MKKDRNTFFSEYGFNGNNGQPNMNAVNPQSNMMMPGGDPRFLQNLPGFGGNQSHGTHPHHGHDAGHQMPMPTDIDARIAKLERAMNRLETRVSKLEGDGHISHSDHDSHFNNSMYMV